MRRKAAVIAYDITSDRRRRRLFRVLKSWKLDAQYSVFECKLTATEARELFLQLAAFLDEKEDALLLTWIDNSREAQAVTTGSRIGFKDPVLYAK